ncbi:MAG: Alpha,alpha-trehalose-phosphate synthase (UDP-forming) [Rhodocyclaceae bacterium]|nr:Alpha,alpha-trehalose-phosphate synthase (UDP-forming) [Rhodocyclaceae bacterium]
MPLALRFILPLLIVLAAFAYAVMPVVDKLTMRWFVRDLDVRATLIATTVQVPLEDELATRSAVRINDFLNRISRDERLFAVGYCPAPASRAVASRYFPAEIHCSDLSLWEGENGQLLDTPSGPLHVSVKPLITADAPDGRLVLVHDMSFFARRSEETRRYIFYFFIGLALSVSLITVIVAQFAWRGWVQGMRSLLQGAGHSRHNPVPPAKVVPEFKPIARDLQRLIRDLQSEYRARDESQLTWTPDTLRAILHSELRGENIIVVSNREPYIHERRGDAIEVQRPASGLVTALEPIMRACSGTWIAQGSGSADRAVVDGRDHVPVPPERPAYEIRRIWLSQEEEQGYYYGFANEGLWPLCHIAHVRPVFRSSDWNYYQEVNRRFAEAVVAESTTKDPIVLVQDYHFALLPRMIREALPEATIIAFWHIPWPNPEDFAICPWREEILTGMLGSSILGFHTQFHCNNFVDTVDRFLEARVDRESFTVTLGGKATAVRRYPISIAWPPDPAMVAVPVPRCREEIRRREGLPMETAIGFGVDRLDYTKGILERLRAIERLLELKPEWIGRFCFIQVAAPSRSSIDEYQHHEAEVRAQAAQINERFGGGGVPPIVLRIEHHEPEDVYRYYRAAELCFVSSLHDGMNLVAKEFIAARDDEQGVLILSQFTGAARELPEALIVNPYDIDQCAAALHLALTMPADEQRDRMRLMRGLVSEFNVYRWAGRMLLDAAIMRRRGRLLDKDGEQTAPATLPT